MASISLVVTQLVLDRVRAGNPGERQIAIRSASPDIQARIQATNYANRVSIRLGGCITLVCGDSGAIWRAHNSQQYTDDFDSLYALLARRPGVEMRFLCELE